MQVGCDAIMSATSGDLVICSTVWSNKKYSRIFGGMVDTWRQAVGGLSGPRWSIGDVGVHCFDAQGIEAGHLIYHYIRFDRLFEELNQQEHRSSHTLNLFPMMTRR